MGSSALKGVLLSATGDVVARAEAQVTTHYPFPGHVEQDPAEWVAAMATVVRELLTTIPGAAARIVGVGLSGAAHIPVMLDEAGRVIRPAVMWSDQRATREADAAGLAADLLSICHNAATPGWTLPQLMWLRSHAAAEFSQLRKLVFGKDYLLLSLTGEIATDTGNAASTLLMVAESADWSDTLCGIAGIEAAMLPPIVGPSDMVGRITPAASDLTGLPVGIPVVAGGLDSVLELLALGVLAPGEAMLRLGTAGGIMGVSAVPRPHARIITYPHVNGLWCAQAINNACGSALAWYKTLWADDGAKTGGFDELDGLAAQVPAGADGITFHPYLLGERAPLWDPGIRASFTGLSMRHGRAEMARAVLEGIACAMRDCRDGLSGAGYVVTRLRATGGGTRSGVWMAILRDMLEMPIDRMRPEGSALGAAMLAGTANGMFAGLEEAVRACVGEGEAVSAAGAMQGRATAVMTRYRARRDILQAMYLNEA